MEKFWDIGDGKVWVWEEGGMGMCRVMGPDGVGDWMGKER